MGIEETFGQGGLNHLVDPDELVEEIGLDEAEIAWRKEFVGFDADDERRLSDLEGVLREHQDEIAERFYDNLTGYEETTAVIGRSPKGVEQLKQTQRAYMVTLATGEYDRAYFRNRARIGKLHDLIDMPLKHYVGQYGVYYDLLFSVLEERVQRQVVDAIREWTAEEVQDDGGITAVVRSLTGGDEDPEEVAAGLEATVEEQIHDAIRDLLALLKVMTLDMGVAADTYVHSYSQRLEEQIDARERLAREVEADLAEPLEDLNAAAVRIAESSQQISDLATTQSEAMRSTSAAVADLSATMEEIAATTDEVRERTDDAADRAQRGREAAEQARNAMDDVGQSVETVGREVDSLDRRLDAVDDVLEEVRGVADRSESIATRATVEAAQADSPAFEAVAEEVQNFANESRDQLARVEARIEDLRADLQSTVTELESTVEAVEDGREDVETAVSDLSGIATTVEDVSGDVDAVAAATEDGAGTAERVATAVEDATETANEVAREAEDVAAANQEQRANVTEVAESAQRLADGVDDDEVRRPHGLED
jgi:methyl-accepting chemotaxis protein